MSLVCFECGGDVQPGMVFPEREGGMLSVNVSGGIGNLTGNHDDFAFVEAPSRSALCFECLLGIRPCEIYHNRLRGVFAAYNAEVALNRIVNQQEGNWVGGEAMDEREALLKVFEQVSLRISIRSCLCCTKPLPDGHAPHFTFRVMDRAHAEGRTSMFGSYQWSHIKTGDTRFRLCLGCVKDHLPRSFAGAGEMLRGKKPDPPPNIEGVGQIQMLNDITPEQEELIGQHPEHR